MNSRKNLAALAVILGLAMVISGCAGGNSGIRIALGPSGTQNAAAGQIVTVSATVSNDSKAAGVTWSLSGPGALSAQTTTSVTYTAPSPISANATATITATSASDTAKTAILTINLQAVSIAFTPSTAQTDEQGQTTSVTAAVSNDPKTKGVTWSLTGAGALSGQTATAVIYTAPASIATASTATITATSVFDNTKTTILTINLVPPPSVTTTSAMLPAGTAGAVYTATNLAATGGVAPYTWTVTSAANTFPGGLVLSGAGAISGTATAFGTFNFTVQVKDADNFTATANLSIKVNPAPVAVTSTSLPNGVVNSAGYSVALTSTGGAPPITWSWTAQAGSTLPPGLVLAPATGIISGTPTSAGTFNVSVTATDSSTPALTASKNLSITVIPQLAITTASPLPNGITSTAYTGVTLASTGGSGAVAWTVAAGSTLPGNLSLNASTGAITGTPTTAGIFSFTVQAADSGTPQQKVTKVFSVTIIQQLVITTQATLHIGSVSTPYSVTLASSGGTGAVTWALASGSTLPGGLTLSGAGVLAGTPTTANSYNFSITASDSGVPPQTATVAFALTVTPKLTITTTSLPSGTLGTAYGTTVLSNNGGISPYAWSWVAQAGSSLPPGLSIASGTGIIFGTPTAIGAFNVTVTVADSSTPTAQTASANFTISIASAPLSVATTGLPNGVVGQAYTGAVLQSAGGNPPVTWSISGGSLPSWASLNSSTGAITGTPAATGTTTFTVKATDSTSPTAQTATKQLSITVIAALSITTTQAQIPAGVVGNGYNATVSATGGTTPYSWSWAPQAASSLPPGLSINSGTGAISGTPGGSGGAFNVTVTVTDSTNPQQTASANFTITITVATLSVTTTSGSLPTGTVNAAYPNTSLSAIGGIPPYTWSLTGGTNLPAGLSLSSSGQITGTPTATGTTNFSVQVSDSATPTPNTATANLSITVNAAPTCVSGGSESLLNGPYAFVLKGFDNGTGTGETSPQPALVGGVLTFNGSGGITAGAIDMNLNSGVQTSLAVISGSSYGVTSDHRGCMVITTSAGAQNYRFSLGNITSGIASTGHVIDFDSTGPFTAGDMRKQTSAAFGTGASQISGNYAFGVSSAQNIANCNTINSTNVCGGGFGAVGVFNFSSGSVTGGEVDFNNNGQMDSSSTTAWPATPVSIGSGSYTVSTTNGRGTLSFTPTGATAVNAIIYVVSATDVLVMSGDSQTGVNSNTIFGGELLKQSGAFSANPLSGAYIGYQSGLGSASGTSRTTLLLLNASGTSISGTQLRNDGGSFQSKSLTGITYSVTSSGRMTVTGGSNPPIFYLVSANEAFALNGDTTVATGVFQSQTGSPFSNSSASGTYAFGTVDPQDSNEGDSLGVATFTPATTSISVINDNNSNGSQSLDQTQTMSYSVDSTGLGMIPSSGSTCTISASSTTCQTVFYVISSTKAVVMDTQSSNPKVQVADQ